MAIFCQKIKKKTLFILTGSCEMFIHFTGYFFVIHATFCLLHGYMQLVDSVLFSTTNFDLLYLSFPDSLEYIVCQQRKSLFASPIIDISLTIMGARWFYLSCIRRDLISPLRVLSGSKQHNLSLVSVLFV